jgi:O-antigen/teichoic acid export membrane protein
LGKAFDVVSDVFFGLYQLNEHMDRIAKPLMVNGLLSVVALGAGVYLTDSVVWGAVGWAAAKGIILIALCLGSGAYVLQVEGGGVAPAGPKPSWAPRRVLQLAWLTLPLCIAALLLQLNTNLPRYFIQHYLGERQLGLFAAMTYLMVPGNMVMVSALGQVAMPRLAKYYAAGNVRAFLSLLLRMVGLVGMGGGLAVLVVLLAGGTILSLLYTPEYAEHTDLFVWIAIDAALGFVGAFLAYGMTAARHFRAQAPLSAVTVIIASLACTVLISGYGLRGAVFAMVTATSFQLIGSIVILVLAVRERGKEG